MNPCNLAIILLTHEQMTDYMHGWFQFYGAIRGEICSGDYEDAKQQKEFSNSILKAWRGWLDSI